MAGAFFSAGKAKISISPRMDRFFPEVKAQLRSHPAVHYNVQVHPDLSNFGRELYAQLKRIKAQKNVQVHADTTQARTEIATLTRDRKVKVKADIDRSAMSQLNSLSGKLSQTRRIKTDVDSRKLSALGSTIDASAGAITRLNQRVLETGRYFGALGQIVMVSAAALAGFAAVSLVPLLGSMTQFVGILATVPALATTAAGALASMVIGFGGIGDAFKAFGDMNKKAVSSSKDASKAQQSAYKQQRNALRSLEDAQRGVEDAEKDRARTARQGARQIEDAEKAVARATKNTQDAREDLTRAYKDAREEIEDLNLAAKGTALDEKSAILGVARARQRLAELPKDKDATWLDWEEARLGIEEAEHRLLEVRERNKDIRDEAAQANRTGVEGMQQVVGAKQAVQDATEAQAEAERNLADTHVSVAEANADAQRRVEDAYRNVADAQERVAEAAEDVAEALAGNSSDEVDKLAEALAKLSPNARKFVEDVVSLKGSWDELKNSVQDRLFDGLGQDVKFLAEQQLPTLKQGLSDIAGELNGGFRSALKVFSEESSVRDFAKTLSNSKIAVGNLADSMSPLSRAWIDLSTVGSTFLPQISQGWEDATHHFANFIDNARRTGELERYIDRSLTKTHQLSSVFFNLGSIVASTFRATRALGDGMFRSMDQSTEKFAVWAKSFEGQNKIRDFFTGASEALDTMTDVIGNLFEILVDGVIPAFEAFGVVGDIIQGVSGFLADHVELVQLALEGYLAWKVAGIGMKVLGPIYKTITDRIAVARAQQGLFVSSFSGMTGQMGRFGTAIQRMGTFIPVIGSMQTAFLRAGENALGFSNHAATAAAKSALLSSAWGAMRGAASGLWNIIGGPAGLITLLASAGIAIFAMNMMKNKQAAQEFESAVQGVQGTLDEVTGAVTRKTYVMKAEELANKGAIDQARELAGIQEKDLVAAHLKNKDALEEVTEALSDQVRKSVEASGSWAKDAGRYEAAGVTIDELTAAILGNEDALNSAAGKIRAYNTELINGGAPQSAMLDGVNELKGSMDGAGDTALELMDGIKQSNEQLDIAAQRNRDAALAMENGDTAARDYSTAMDVLRDSASTAEQKVNALRDAIDLMSGNKKDITQALIDQAEAIDQMAEAAKRWAENGAPTFDVNGEIVYDNEAARDWYRDAEDVARAATNVAVAAADQALQTSKATTETERQAEAMAAAEQAMADAKQKFIDQQIQLGLNEESVRLYADRLFGVPTVVATQIVTPNMAPATLGWQLLKDKIDLVPDDKKITVETLSDADRQALELLEFTIQDVDGNVEIIPDTPAAQALLDYWIDEMEKKKSLQLRLEVVGDAVAKYGANSREAWLAAMNGKTESLTKDEWDAKFGAGAWDKMQAERAARAQSGGAAPPQERVHGITGNGWSIFGNQGATAPAVDSGAELDQSAGKFESFAGRVDKAYKEKVAPAMSGIKSDAASVNASVGAEIEQGAVSKWSTLPNTVEQSKKDKIDAAYQAIRQGNADLATDFLKLIGEDATENFAMLPTGVGKDVATIKDSHFVSLSGGLDTLRTKFSDIVKAIGEKWAEIRKAVAEPINYVIRTVINGGLRPAWNTVRKFIPALPEWTDEVPEIQAYREGGKVRGPGSGTSDSIFARLSNGEHVWTASEVQAAGGHGVVEELRQRAKTGRLPAFRTGGPVGDGLPRFVAGGVVLATDVDKWLASMIEERFGPTNYISSGYREGDLGGRSYHAQGKAVDVGGPIGPMQGIAQWIANTYPQSAQLIHHPFQNNILNGMNVGDGFGSPGYGAGTMAQHADHVHWAADSMMQELSDEEKKSLFARLGSFISGTVNSVRNKIADVFEKPLREIGDKIPTFGDSAWGTLPKLWYDSIVNKAISHVRGAGNAAVEAGNTPWDFSAGVEQWHDNIVAALIREGFEPSERNINLTKAQMQTESSGNPNIIQQVQDVNSGGNEAVGLMQVTPGTFATFRNPDLPNDRTNPDASLSAALRWYRFKHGDDLGAMWGKGHGYDQGGWLPDGGFGWNKSGKPEPVFTAEQWKKLSELIRLLGDAAPAIGAVVANPSDPNAIFNALSTVIPRAANLLSNNTEGGGLLPFQAIPGKFEGDVPRDKDPMVGYDPETFPYDAPGDDAYESYVEAQTATGGDDLASKAGAMALEHGKGWLDYFWNYGPSMLTGDFLGEGIFGSTAPEIPMPAIPPVQINTGPISTNSWVDAQKVITRAVNRASAAAQLKGGR